MDLPEEWYNFKKYPNTDAYYEVISCAAYVKAVEANKRPMGSRKYGWTRKVLSHWEPDVVKTVVEMQAMLRAVAGDDEQMQAKLLRSLSSHLRFSKDPNGLRRVRP